MAILAINEELKRESEDLDEEDAQEEYDQLKKDPRQLLRAYFELKYGNETEYVFKMKRNILKFVTMNEEGELEFTIVVLPD